MKTTIILAAALGCGLAGCESTGPHLEVPTPPHDRYVACEPTAICAVSSKDVWVVGSLTTSAGSPEGLLLSSQDGGKTWRRAAVEVHDLGNVTFTTVWFADRMRGWVGGRRITPEGRQRAVVFRTYDSGNHWSEHPLPSDDAQTIADVHALGFKSDTEGHVTVAYGAKDGARESVFETGDGGRLWTVTAFREAVKPVAEATADAKPMENRLISYVNLSNANGFRLTRSSRPGVTMIEITASAGQDWMPVSELSVSYVPTFYTQSP